MSGGDKTKVTAAPLPLRIGAPQLSKSQARCVPAQSIARLRATTPKAPERSTSSRRVQVLELVGERPDAR